MAWNELNGMVLNDLLVGSKWQSFRRSLVCKVIVLAFIVLVLLVPYFLAVNLRVERQCRMEDAGEEVSSKWGREQTLVAPILSVPVQKTVRQGDNQKLTTSTWCLLPDTLDIECGVTPEIRYRGIYQVALYKSVIHFKATFASLPIVPPDGWQLDKSGGLKLLFYISDVKGIQSMTAKVGDEAVMARPGGIISFPVSLAKVENGFQLTAELELNGFKNLYFAPLGRDFTLAMDSTWPHPSFTGGFLPSERQISDKGFKAKWVVNELNSSFDKNWIEAPSSKSPSCSNSSDICSKSKCLGVSLALPSGTYQQVERVSDYAFLLVAIVLIAFLIGETVTRIWIHPLQYFFAGLSLIMFYVLLLALAEHINFYLSYWVTTLVIAGMTTLYCKMIFARKPSAALLLGGVMFLAYALIFVLTRMEDYALLMGSFVLLVLLGVLMRITGHLNREESAVPEGEGQIEHLER